MFVYDCNLETAEYKHKLYSILPVYVFRFELNSFKPAILSKNLNWYFIYL